MSHAPLPTPAGCGLALLVPWNMYVPYRPHDIPWEISKLYPCLPSFFSSGLWHCTQHWDDRDEQAWHCSCPCGTLSVVEGQILHRHGHAGGGWIPPLPFPKWWSGKSLAVELATLALTLSAATGVALHYYMLSSLGLVSSSVKLKRWLCRIRQLADEHSIEY